MRKRALLIGINDYPFIGNLKYAEQDAEAFSESLQRNYDFTRNEIVLMKPGLDVAHFPTQRVMERQLRLLRDSRMEIDLLLVGFWGHGFTGTDGKRYLCATDTDDEDLIRTGIAFDSLLSTISQIGAGDTCLILDCCQNAPGRGLSSNFTESTEEELVRGVMTMSRDIQTVRQEKGFKKRQPSLAILNSCSVGERAYEWEERQHGLFTAHLLDAMDRQSRTVSDWMAYLGQYVSESAHSMSHRQHPYFKLEGGGVISFPVTGTGTPPPHLPEPTSILPSVDVEAETERIYLRLKAEEEAKSRLAEAERKARERLEQERQRQERQRLEREKAEQERQRLEELRKSGQGDKAGERRVETISGVEYAFCWCPAGTFLMGSPADEKGRCGDESQHEVTLTRGFWLLETPVTQMMWKSVMGENPSDFSSTGYFKDIISGSTGQYPVENVSWNDCQKFIGKLNGLFNSSLRFRLPTESEWEYACRAGTTTPFNFGNILNGDQANCNGNNPYGTKTKGPYLKKTTPVKTYSPNAWGLYDMHGNVWEWCEDWYGDYPSDKVTDPQGPHSDWLRVSRGGSWNDSARLCRSAYRYGVDPVNRFSHLGFRLALSSTR